MESFLGIVSEENNVRAKSVIFVTVIHGASINLFLGYEYEVDINVRVSHEFLCLVFLQLTFFQFR